MTHTPETCTPAWAHSTGMIDLQPVSPVPNEVGVVADRLMVQETVARYAIAYDERRLDVLENLMTESVTFSHKVGGGALASQSGRATVVTWLGRIMGSQPDQRRHILGSLAIEHLTADEAVVISYKAIYGIEMDARLVTTGLYRFRMLKLNNKWLIDEVVDALDRPF